MEKKKGILIAGAIGLSILAFIVTDNLWAAKQVSDNSTLALQACGEGNVRSVTIEGFDCKE